MTLDTSTGSPVKSLCPGASYRVQVSWSDSNGTAASARDALLTTTLGAFVASPAVEAGW